MKEGEITELRALPAVGTVLSRPALASLVAELGHASVAEAVRAEVARCRAEVEAGRAATFSEDAVLRAARAHHAGTLRPVLNATGILVHTNLGRVPLAPAAIAAMEAVARGGSSLELDLDTGRRGHRHVHVVEVLRALTGAEDALVVNNNAAAVLLAVSTCAMGREAIVSRGELVEIGGGFRVPDVVALAGAKLREVGTTNRTHRRDYEAAIGPETAAILKVHRSNFEIRGFVAEVESAELAALAHAHGLPFLHDAGSGCMAPIADAAREPPVSRLVAEGADVVTFSGDKLLGGPQAGLVVGRRALVERMRAAPLYRALRPDKLTLAALGATLALWRDRPEALPIVRMIRQPAAAVAARVERILAALGPGRDRSSLASPARIGGGAAPSIELPSHALRLAVPDPDALARRLRAGSPAVLGRIEDGAVLLDPRSLDPDDDARLALAIRAALEASP